MSSDMLKELAAFLTREAACCAQQGSHQEAAKDVLSLLDHIELVRLDIDAQSTTNGDSIAGNSRELFARLYSVIMGRPPAENDMDPAGIHLLAVMALVEGLEYLLFDEHPDRQLAVLNDIDRATIVCRPAKPVLRWIHKVAERVERKHPISVVHKEPAILRQELDNMPRLLRPVKRYSVDDMDVLTFQRAISDTAKCQPFIIENAISSWPALDTRKWSNLEYLRQAVGHHRLVPVEIGTSYTQGDWTMKLMSFGEFLDTVIYPSANNHGGQGESGYLAQHDLLNQALRLKRDYWLPDYTQVETGRRLDAGNVEADDVLVNIWLGPKNTVSPLHFDPYDNMFAQVFGFKYFRLFHPDESARLYPHMDGSRLVNTSQVDVDSPNHEQFPLFAQSQYLDCIAKPGDLLYIPPRWWHYVRSLSVSMSISMWF